MLLPCFAMKPSRLETMCKVTLRLFAFPSLRDIVPPRRRVPQLLSVGNCGIRSGSNCKHRIPAFPNRAEIRRSRGTHECGESSNSREQRSAEFLSDALKNFARKPRIPYGASQYYATDHRRCPKDGFFPAPTDRGKNFPKSLLERGFEFRGRASHLRGQCGHGAAVAGIISVPSAQVPVVIRFFALLAFAAPHAL